MTEPTRRGFLAGAAVLPLATAANADAAAAPDAIAADLATYIGFGNKQSGGAGDTACGHWLATELERAGFTVEKPPISVPWFEGSGARSSRAMHAHRSTRSRSSRRRRATA